MFFALSMFMVAITFMSKLQGIVVLSVTCGFVGYIRRGPLPLYTASFEYGTLWS